MKRAMSGVAMVAVTAMMAWAPDARACGLPCQVINGDGGDCPFQASRAVPEELVLTITGTSFGSTSDNSCAAGIAFPAGGTILRAESLEILDATGAPLPEFAGFVADTVATEQLDGLLSSAPLGNDLEWSAFLSPLTGDVRPEEPITFEIRLAVDPNATNAEVRRDLDLILLGAGETDATGALSCGHVHLAFLTQ